MKNTRRTILITTSLLALPLAGCVVDTGPTGPSTPPSAAVNGAYRFDAAGAPKCSGSRAWEYKLLQGSGSAGADSAKHERDDDVISDGGKTCTYRDGTLGLRPGTWRVVLTGSANAVLADCKVQLKAGTNQLDANSCSVA